MENPASAFRVSPARCQSNVRNHPSDILHSPAGLTFTGAQAPNTSGTLLTHVLFVRSGVSLCTCTRVSPRLDKMLAATLMRMSLFTARPRGRRGKGAHRRRKAPEHPKHTPESYSRKWARPRAPWSSPATLCKVRCPLSAQKPGFSAITFKVGRALSPGHHRPGSTYHQRERPFPGDDADESRQQHLRRQTCREVRRFETSNEQSEQHRPFQHAAPVCEQEVAGRVPSGKGKRPFSLGMLTWENTAGSWQPARQEETLPRTRPWWHPDVTLQPPEL